MDLLNSKVKPMYLKYLAASSGIMWNEPQVQEKLNAKNGENRPNAMILCYPVIRGDELTHKGTINNVSGGAEPGTDAYKYWGVDTHVDEGTCPAFVWHTVTDNAVPVENAIAIITALQAKKISFECHNFPDAPHGISICTQEVGRVDPYNGRWVELSKRWLYQLFDFVK